MPYQWDPNVARYRDEGGRFVRQAVITQYVDAGIENSHDTADFIGSLAGEGTISPRTFNDVMRRELKMEYIRQYVLNRGGRNAMAYSDWGRIGGMLTEQYRHLDRFTNEIAAGQLSEAQIKARTRMYFNSAREAAERARRQANALAGFDLVKWTLNPAEHCSDCLALAALGWRPIEPWPFALGRSRSCTPGSGCTVCLTNCRCVLEYRKSE